MKKYDITVFGATGFTGELTVKYLLQRMVEKPFSLAIAGRDVNKLNQMRTQLLAANPHCKEITVIASDVSMYNSLLDMALASKVLITTVGPYVKYGEEVVKACIEANTDYLDLTGEGPFVDTIINRYHEKAKAKKVRIINCSGFDSIPADLGAFFTVSQLPKEEAKTVECFVSFSTKNSNGLWGSVSGGTWHSAIGFMNFGELSRQKESYHRISTTASNARKIYPESIQMKYRSESGSFGVPLPVVDIEVVLRSAADLEIYGPEFQYGHYGAINSLFNLVGAGMITGTVFAMAQFEPTKNYLLGLKKPGDGPNATERANNSFCLSFVGKSKSKTVKTEVSGGDPGYGDTSKILGEAALSLIQDPISDKYGVVTPAVVMGEKLISRLDKAGISFRVTG
jgi:short subunit dehydrogenase-like uncharacterized protein